MVKAAEPRKSRSYRCAFDIPADAKQGLPAGRVELTCFVAEAELRARVDTVYVSLPGRAGPVSETKAFDDAAVVVDLGADGRALGVELTTVAAGITELAQLRRYARKDRFVEVMVATALQLGRRFDLALVDSMATLRSVADQLGAKAVKIDQLRIREELVELVQKEQASRWQLASA